MTCETPPLCKSNHLRHLPLHIHCVNMIFQFIASMHCLEKSGPQMQIIRRTFPHCIHVDDMMFPFSSCACRALQQAGGLESFHSKALRKTHRIPATSYTKVLDTSQPTISNQQLRQQATQPPLTTFTGHS